MNLDRRMPPWTVTPLWRSPYAICRVQGDFGRAARQRQVINAIVKKGASKQTLTNFNKTKRSLAAMELRNRG